MAGKKKPLQNMSDEEFMDELKKALPADQVKKLANSKIVSEALGDKPNETDDNGND